MISSVDNSLELQEAAALIRPFVRMCNDAWLQGWHESNGGNLSCRLNEEDERLDAMRQEKSSGVETPLGFSVPELQGASFIVTAAGSAFRTLADDPLSSLGIIEITHEGKAWRAVAGLKNGARPTSEFPSHLLLHAMQAKEHSSLKRVVYHAHLPHISALTALQAPSSREFSRILWKSFTESIAMSPSGVGVIPWMVPGTHELAEATKTLMEHHSVVIWPHHGAICKAATYDEAFGIMHTIEKAAGIYLRALSASGCKAPNRAIKDDDVRAAAKAFGVTLNESFLD